MYARLSILVENGKVFSQDGGNRFAYISNSKTILEPIKTIRLTNR